MSARVYPVPRPADDPRFVYGLMFDVAAVLESYGYPRPVGPDLVELGQALFRFVYAPAEVPDGMAQARAVEDRIAAELADARQGHGQTDPGAALTFAEYRSALAWWERKAIEAQAAGDQGALAYRTRGVEALQERVRRAEVVAQRGDWHPDLPEAAVFELASHATYPNQPPA